MDTVRLTVARQGEADVICGLLRSYGIECSHRETDMYAERGGSWGGWCDVLVWETDLAAARELLATADVKQPPEQ